jgi:hypothetical protein
MTQYVGAPQRSLALARCAERHVEESVQEQPMASAPTLTDNKRIARQIPEAVATAGDLDLIDTICAVDLADHSPLGEVASREEFREQMESIRGAFSDFSATVDDVVAEEDTVAMRVTLRGTHDGSFMGVEPGAVDMPER